MTFHTMEHADMYNTWCLVGTKAKLTLDAGTQKDQPARSVGKASRRTLPGYSATVPPQIAPHRKNVVTTIGPNTAWFKKTLAANGESDSAVSANARAGNFEASAMYQ